MQERLTALEEAVLLTVGILANEAYPARISEELRARISRELSVATVHSILIRLESKGIVNSVVTQVKEGRTKRKRRIYSVSTEGRQKNNIPYLKETMENYLHLYHAPTTLFKLKLKKRIINL